MIRHRFHLVALAACAFVIGIASPAITAEAWDEPFAAPAATLLAEANAIPAKDADSALVLLEEGRYTFDADGRVTRAYRLVYRLTSQEGVEDWSRLETGFASFHQARPEVKARVISPSGEEHWLDQATIDDTPASDDPDLYDDQRILRAPLPRLAVGAVVEQESITRDEAPLFDGASMGVFYFGQSQPAHVIRLIVDAPSSLPVRFSAKGLDGLEPTRTEKDGRTRVVYEKRDAPAWDRDTVLLPPEALRWPHVGFTTGRSWSQVAARYGEMAEKCVDAESVADMAKKATAGLTDRRAIVAACVAALRDRLRYAGIEFGTSAIIPAKPPLALQRGYGDCKDQATFLVSMLRSLGIPASLALLEPGPGADVDEDLPGVALFGHAITHVPGTPPLWVDTTDPYTPVGELPDADQGRLALIVDPATTGLTRTPLSTSKDNRVVERVEMRLSEAGPAAIREDAEAWGILASEYRSNYDGATPEDIEATLREYAQDMYLADSIEGVEHSDGSKLEPSYELKFTAPKAHRGFTDMRQAAAAFVALPTYARLATLLDLVDADEEGDAPADEDPPPAVEGAKESGAEAKDEPVRPRDADWMIPEAFSWERRYHVIPPPGFQLRSAPEPVSKRLGPASFTSEVTNETDGSVTVVHRFDTGGQRFTDAQWKALRAGLDELTGAKPEVVLFDNVGELHLAEGRIREALAQFRVVAALHPTEALHRVQVSRTLLAAGLGAAALAEAQRAVDVEPASGLAHRVLGYTAEHDALGRRFGPGSDPEAAVRHLRKAVELAPEDPIARSELAFVLERDDQGELRWDGPRLAEAIAEYRALRALTPDEDDDASDEALLAALARSGDWAGARSLADDMPPSESRDATILQCVAAAEGAQAALARSLKPPFDAADRSAALRNAASRLKQSRLYPEVVALFEEAAKGTSGTAEIHEAVDLFRRVKPYEQGLLPASDPASVVQRVEMAVVLKKPEALVRMLSRAHDVTKEDTATMMTASRAAKVGGGIRPEALLDLMMSTQQLLKDGDDVNGWRVRVRRMGMEVDESSDAYVVRENGEWRIAALGNSPEDLGRFALDRIEAGDLPGARKWLDWAREHYRPGDAEDPVWMEPFPRAWKKGQEATEAQARVAAAMLASRTADRARGLAILRASRETATPEQAIDLDMAAFRAILGRARKDRTPDEEAEALRLARSVAAAQPTSATAFETLAVALTMTAGWTELEDETRRRLERAPGDPDLERTLANCLAMAGRLPEAVTIFRGLVDRGEEDPADLNMLAWLALFTGTSLDQALEDGQAAVQRSRGSVAAYLHTLASVLAESGRASAAREILLRTIDADRRSEPEPSDWYVVGRIAEEHGEIAAALDAYRRVEMDEIDKVTPHLSCHRLAERRIAGLTAGGGK